MTDAQKKHLDPSDLETLRVMSQASSHVQAQLGALRATYLIQERRLLEELEESHASLEQLIRTLANRYLADADGEYSLDLAAGAFTLTNQEEQ